jgi:hypothetical protein
MESRNRVVGIVVLLTLMSLLGGLLALRGGIGNRKPLGEGQLIHFESTSTPEDTVRQFLDGDFALIKNVESLPRPILKAYTEVGGSRPVLANPGKRFEATDFIVDNSLPRNPSRVLRTHLLEHNEGALVGILRTSEGYRRSTFSGESWLFAMTDESRSIFRSEKRKSPLLAQRAFDQEEERRLIFTRARSSARALLV